MSEPEDDPAEPPSGTQPPEGAAPEVLPEVPAADDDSVAEVYQQRARLAEDRLAEVLAAYREFRQETEAYRERLTRQLQRKFEHRHEALLLKFIDILDNFDRALEASQTAGDSLVEGLILVRTQLLQMLQDEGLERIPVLGLPFDPHLSEAVTTVPVDDPDQHHVVMQEMLRGYRIKGKIARASRVAIGDYASPPAAAAAPAPHHAHDELIGEPAPEPAGQKATPPAGTARVEADAEAEPVVEAEAEPVVEAEPEVVVLDADAAVAEADSGLSLDEIIARAEAREAETLPEPGAEKQAILYDDLTELAEVDESVVGAEEGERDEGEK